MKNTERIQANNAELREAIEMAESLPDVGEGGEPTPTQEKTIDITENGTHTVTPDEGYALSKVMANVNVPIPEGYIKPNGTLEVTENDTFDVTDKVSVNVNVPTGDPGGFAETVTEITMSLPQISAGNFSSASVDYTPVYQNSVIVLDVIDCHLNEAGDLYGFPVVFQVLPKYENYQKVEGVKSITAIRMGTSTAKIDITLKVHEIKCS